MSGLTLVIAAATARSSSVVSVSQNAPPAATPAAPTGRDNASLPTNSKPNPYGYHNTFHTHSLPSTSETVPPTYDTVVATSPRPTNREVLPRYSCSVTHEGLVSMKNELLTPFLSSVDERWRDVYVVLRGTQLYIHRPKTTYFGRRIKPLQPGRCIDSYTLQHAEVGLATDFAKAGLRPKHGLAKLLPVSTWAKVHESDPQLFEPVREHVIRLRLETEQFLFCVETQEQMLDWVERLCAAIDISQPLEVRSEPKYRTMPRRSRRPRQLDARTLQNLDNLGSLAEGIRILREQERIIRRMYPQLTEGGADAVPSEPAVEETAADAGQDAGQDADAYDREDFLFPPTSPQRPSSARSATAIIAASRRLSIISASNRLSVIDPLAESAATRRASAISTPQPNTSSRARISYDPKAASPRTITASQALRYRRRCCPVLLFNSPRASNVVLRHGVRLRLDMKRQLLVEFEESPPKYEAHDFTDGGRAAALATTNAATNEQPETGSQALVRRPQSRRAETDSSDYFSGRQDAEASSNEQEQEDAIEGAPLCRELSEDASPPPSPGFASGRAKEAMTVTVGGKSITVPHTEHVGFGFAMGLRGQGIIGL